MTKTEMRKWLERHDLTDEDAAKLFGITRMAVHHWVSGRRTVSVTIGRLCALFDRRPGLMKEF